MTNSAALSALQTLRGISSQMDDTQSAISSGLRVSKASDNAAYWSIATTMRSDNMALSAVQDALGLGAAKVDTAYAGMEAAIDVVKEMKKKVTAATEQGVDKAKVQEEIKQLQEQLVSISSGAAFNGQNWLSWNTGADSADKSIPAYFIRNSDGTVRVGTVSYPINTPAPRTSTDVQYFVDNGGSGEYGILSTEAFAVEVGSAKNYVMLKGATAPATAVDIAIDNSTTDDELDDMLATVEGMTKQMTAVASTIGSLSKGVEMSMDFAHDLSDSVDSGVGRLVDADMEDESSKLTAQQTQQQLAIQSLSIANNAPQNLLSLFRN